MGHCYNTAGDVSSTNTNGGYNVDITSRMMLFKGFLHTMRLEDVAHVREVICTYVWYAGCRPLFMELFYSRV